MSVVVLRSIKAPSGAASVLWTAIGFSAAFAAVGLVIGWVADATVVGSVTAQFDEEVRNQTRRAEQPAPASRP
jgi:hypothetical protein